MLVWGNKIANITKYLFLKPNNTEELETPTDPFKIQTATETGDQFKKIFCHPNVQYNKLFSSIDNHLNPLDFPIDLVDIMEVISKNKQYLNRNFFRSLCDIEIDGNEETRLNYYHLVFHRSVFPEITTNLEARNTIFSIPKMLGPNIEHLSDKLEYAIDHHIELNFGDIASAVKSMHEELKYIHSFVEELFTSITGNEDKKQNIYNYFSYGRIINGPNWLTNIVTTFNQYANTSNKLDKTVNRLKSYSFTNLQIATILSSAIELNPNQDILALINTGLDAIEEMDVDIGNKIATYLIYETVFTKMDGDILRHGIEIFKRLCPNKKTRSQVVNNYGAGTLQIIYLLYNSWVVETKNTNNSELTYKDAIATWMNKVGVNNADKLLVSFLKICSIAFHKYGIRYWGRFSINSLWTILKGEKEQKSALIVMAKDADRNGAYYLAYRDLELLLNEGYNLVVSEIETDKELFNFLDKRLDSLQNRSRPLFSSMDVMGHGFPHIATFTKDIGDEGTLDCEDEALRKYVPLFESGARISLDACYTGLELLECVYGFMKEIPNARFEAPLEATSSELKRDPFTREFYRKYTTGETRYLGAPLLSFFVYFD